MTEQIHITDADWASFDSRLRAFVRSRVDPVWADDVTGAILLRLVEHRDALEAAGNPVAYMYRVATNAVTDHYRRRATERRAVAEAERVREPGADEGDDARAAATAEIARCFEAFITALPDTYREALELVELEGLTQSEAAKRLDLSASGMKSRVQRGRALLRKAVLRCCAVEFDRQGGMLGFERRGTGCGPAC